MPTTGRPETREHLEVGRSKAGRELLQAGHHGAPRLGMGHYLPVTQVVFPGRLVTLEVWMA